MPSYSAHHLILRDGLWRVAIAGDEAAPDPVLTVTHAGAVLGDAALSHQGPGAWLLQVRVPSEAIGEGTQTLVVSAENSADPLICLTLHLGAQFQDDLRAEVALLRAELDMLKRAFRRHCLETADDGA
ncbi:MAG: hypothetical protein KDK26_12435 [Roseivivax sp.]|nr:hypothetical protein [Roseivivax sp.]